MPSLGMSEPPLRSAERKPVVYFLRSDAHEARTTGSGGGTLPAESGKARL